MGQHVGLVHDTGLSTDSDIDEGRNDVYLTRYVSDVGSREESGETVSISVAHLGKKSRKMSSYDTRQCIIGIFHLFLFLLTAVHCWPRV